MENKSLLDRIDEATARFYNIPENAISRTEDLTIVGHCTCGAPVYGKQAIKQGDVPVSIYSCQCHASKAITDSMQTK